LSRTKVTTTITRTIPTRTRLSVVRKAGNIVNHHMMESEKAMLKKTFLYIIEWLQSNRNKKLK